MSKYPEIQKYLKNIERELGDVGQTLKDSIIQEIREHLDEKIEDFKKSANVKKLSSKKIKKVLEEFGEPEEIALEYRKQFSEEQQIVTIKKRLSAKGIAISILAILIVISIIISFFYSFTYSDNDYGLSDTTIYEGKGLKEIEIGDDLDKIKEVLGEPEQRQDTSNTIWVEYNEEYGIDFLLSKNTYTIIEIRFNPGFDGALTNGISIGSSLDDILNVSGGALKTVQANLTETHTVQLGSDRVLYEQYINNNLTAYKFIDAKKGILFWFNTDKKVTQIVVFRPYDY